MRNGSSSVHVGRGGRGHMHPPQTLLLDINYWKIVTPLSHGSIQCFKLLIQFM